MFLRKRAQNLFDGPFIDSRNICMSQNVAFLVKGVRFDTQGYQSFVCPAPVLDVRNELCGFLKKTGRTPPANASRMPVCPAFLAPTILLTRFKTSNDVTPSGLSTTRTPFIAAIRKCLEGDDERRVPWLPAGGHRKRLQRPSYVLHLQRRRIRRPHPVCRLSVAIFWFC